MQNTRPTIAIFAAEYSDYQKVLVDNIATACARKGFGTLCIAGRELNPRLENLQDLSLGNEIYQVLSDSPIKGLISLSGSIGNNVSLDQLTDFLNQFDLPLVSIGIAVPGIPNVLVDDQAAMSQLMKHLINETGSKRFAFIRGFSNDPYSQQRENIFRQELDRAGLSVDEDLIVSGNYNAFETYQAINNLMAVQGATLDAIVAANDSMALSAARAVAAHGLDVPGNIVISGFDDTSEATQHSPALTTIRQPLIDMANSSVDLLLAQIETWQNNISDTDLANVTVHSELIIRGSTVSSGPNTGSTLPTSKDALYTHIKLAMSGLDNPSKIDLRSLTDSFWHTLEDGGAHLSEALGPGLIDDIQLEQRHWWSNFSHHIETYARRVLSSEVNAHRISAVTAALSPLKERSWALTMEKEFATQRFNGAQASMQLQVSSCSRLDDILTATAKWLNDIEPKRCYLARYASPSTLPHSQSELIQIFENGDVKKRSNGMFETNNLLPEDRMPQLEKGLLVLSPIFAGDLHYGYLLLDPHGLKTIDLSSAARSIGNAMRSQYLVDKLEQHARTLEQTNTELVQLANFDSVTALPNRLHFHQKLDDALSELDSETSALSLIFVDLDGFKGVNDTMGHDAGDELLKIIARRLRSCVHALAGDNGFVSRLGGDEFTVIIETQKTVGQPLLEEITEKILRTVREPCEIQGRVAMVSASIGYTFYSSKADNVEALMKQADRAMYKSKDNGKNRITFISGNESQDHVLDTGSSRSAA